MDKHNVMINSLYAVAKNAQKNRKQKTVHITSEEFISFWTALITD
jgi:hypothetical protein